MRPLLNKKAQIATPTLVVIALVLSTAALFAMISFNDKLQSQSVEIELLLTQTKQIDDFITDQSKVFGKKLVTECSECSSTEIKEEGAQFDSQRTYRFKEEGNFFAKLRNGQFEFYEDSETYYLEVNEIYYRIERGNNKIERRFDICIALDKEGNFKGECKEEQ